MNKIENRRQLSTTVACIYGEQIWLSCGMFNALYKYDIASKKTEYIGKFEGEPNNGWKLHSISLQVGNRIFFLPDTSKSIHYYDIIKKEMGMIYLGEEGRIESHNGIVYEEKIYFITNSSEKKLCIFNTRNSDIKKLKLPNEFQKVNFLYDTIIIEGNIYFINKNTSKILIYNMKEGRFDIINTNVDEGFGTVTYDGQYIWLSNSNGVYQVDEKINIIKQIEYPEKLKLVCLSEEKKLEIINFGERTNKDEKPFTKSKYAYGKIWLFPFRSRDIYTVDINSFHIDKFIIESEYETVKSLSNKDRLTHAHYFCVDADEKLYFISTTTKTIKIVSDSLDVKTIILWADEPMDLCKYIEGVPLMYEGLDGNIQDLIKMIS